MENSPKKPRRTVEKAVLGGAGLRLKNDRTSFSHYEPPRDAGAAPQLKNATGLFGGDYKARAKDILSERFLVPPFSVLNAREGFWQDRKAQWISLGIRSELGRGYTKDAATYNTGKPGDLGKAFKDASPTGRAFPAVKATKNPDGTWARGDGRGRVLPPDGSGLTFRVNDLDKFRNKEKEKRKGLTGNMSHAEAFAAPAAHAGSKGPSGSLIRQPGSRSVYLYANDGDGDVHAVQGGTSIFDPVLCELIYRWFCPPDGKVLDPFSGGSVRGIVAGEMGLHYAGIDLSARQLEANREQAAAIGTQPAPSWVHGDSVEIEKLVKPLNNFDLMFSCPPYGDLEVYSDDPRDLSTLPVNDFDDKYAQIIANATKLMSPNAFACFVVGDYRNKDGFYCNFPTKTIASFLDAGWELYNEMILLTAVGSLSLRVSGQFKASRKVGKSHQNVLVFCRGNPKDFTRTWPEYS